MSSTNEDAMPRYQPNTEIACRACGEPFVLSERGARQSVYTCGPCRYQAAKPRLQLKPKSTAWTPSPAAAAKRLAYQIGWRKQAYQRDPAFRAKFKARRAVQIAVRYGKLERQPCEVCGAPETDGHHDDYSRPLNVRWLCRTHHLQHHRQLRLAA